MYTKSIYLNTVRHSQTRLQQVNITDTQLRTYLNMKEHKNTSNMAQHEH